jgi:hypothetical protein
VLARSQKCRRHPGPGKSGSRWAPPADRICPARRATCSARRSQAGAPRR